MDSGWIKLHRRLLEWEWYTKSDMVHLFIHLLLRANHNIGNWRGIEIKRGQIVTSLKSLNKETGISIQTLRSCLTRLEKTKEINKQSNNQYTTITILEYDGYQITKEEHNKEANRQVTKRQQTGNKEVTPNKKDKNLKKDNKDKNKYGEFVFLSEVEYKKIEDAHGKYWTKELITMLDNYKGSSGKKYASDYRAILSWVVDKLKCSRKYVDWIAKQRREESLARSRGEKQPLPGAEQVGIKIKKATTTNETPPEIL